MHRHKKDLTGYNLRPFIAAVHGTGLCHVRFFILPVAAAQTKQRPAKRTHRFLGEQRKERRTH